ncbi:MAG: hypothetical protein ABIM98_06880 [candidate division WOR-3 bacterium]
MNSKYFIFSQRYKRKLLKISASTIDGLLKKSTQVERKSQDYIRDRFSTPLWRKIGRLRSFCRT